MRRILRACQLLVIVTLAGGAVSCGGGPMPQDVMRKENDDSPAGLLIGRVLPGHRDAFAIEEIPDENGLDVFEVEAGEDGRIVLRGNNGVSVAVAFNWYLNNVARLRYGWEAAGPLVIPGKLPLPAEKIRRTCAAKERFFMNYCTYGYTMPWWRWTRACGTCSSAPTR